MYLTHVGKNVKTPFFVAGNGDYYNLHNLTVENGATDTNTNATLIYGNDKNHDYVTIAIDNDTVSGYATLIDKSEIVTKKADEFTYTAKATYLADGENAAL